MSFLLRFVGALLLVAIALAAFGYLYIQDANRLKPELQRIIAEQTGIKVVFEGDLRWQLFPPITLSMQQVSVDDGDTQSRIDNLQLQMDLSGIWQDAEQWQVTALRINDATVTTPTGTTFLESLSLSDFQPRKPARLSASFTQTPLAASEPSLTADVDGNVTYFPATADQAQKVQLTQTRFDSNLGQGICDADITDNPQAPAKLPESKDEDLVPVSTLLSYNLVADCQLETLNAGTETFENADLKLTNLAGNTNVFLQIADFLGGTAVLETDIDLNRKPIRWIVRPEVDNIDTQRLLDWQSQSVHWAALFNLNGNVEFSGNSEADLYRTLKSEQQFSGGEGVLDISMLKQQLLQIGALAGKDSSIAKWPERWNYQDLQGSWVTEGTRQVFNLAMDNLNIKARGTVDYVTQQVDMLAEVVINTPPAGSTLSINPMLEGTPLPLRCRGVSADVKCRMDKDAAQTLIARALQRGDDSGLRRKIEQKIDENVPEEYRETARGLLDILGRALEDKEEEK